MESKFNFSEDDNLKSHSSSEKSPLNIGGFISSFFKETLDFSQNTDKESTLNSIKEDISLISDFLLKSLLKWLQGCLQSCPGKFPIVFN